MAGCSYLVDLAVRAAVLVAAAALAEVSAAALVVAAQEGVGNA
jgi:hypothetical protein